MLGVLSSRYLTALTQIQEITARKQLKKKYADTTVESKLRSLQSAVDKLREETVNFDQTRASISGNVNEMLAITTGGMFFFFCFANQKSR